MGGFGSGRHGGRPTADMSKRIDIASMVRTGRVVPGTHMSGTLSWSRGNEPAGWISYSANLIDLYDGELILTYSRGDEPEREHVRQVVRLVFTEPHYGGRRWWMICPYRHNRIGKLYLPNNGDRFAGRQAWRLAYNSQRRTAPERPFETLFRLQKKLGCEQGWEAGISRPKGMWQRTYDRHLNRYSVLNARCDAAMAGGGSVSRDAKSR